MTIEQLAIPGVLLIIPIRFSDDRGWFSETYNHQSFRDRGLDLCFVQDNHSFS
jgi:dTDP-4-dehydrorhamnose 3,5-epimerase